MDFEQLFDRINWNTIQRPGGYPGAERIPQIIRDLLTQIDPIEIQDLSEALYLHLTYNSGLGESTLVTIPILIRLLESSNVRRKGWIIRILGHLYFHNHDDSELNRKLYVAMTEGMPLFHQFLYHRFPNYRSMASRILSRCIHHADDVSFWLRQAITKEQKLDVKLDMIESLGRLLYRNSETASGIKDEALDFLSRMSHQQDIYISAMALSTYLRIAEERMPYQLIDELFDHFKAIGRKRTIDNTLTYSLLDTLTKLDSAFCLNLLLNWLVVTKSSRTASSIGNLLQERYLRSLITTKEAVKGHLAVQMTPTQKQIIEAILANDLYWKGYGSFNLRMFGLAENRRQLHEQVKSATIVG